MANEASARGIKYPSNKNKAKVIYCNESILRFCDATSKRKQNPEMRLKHTAPKLLTKMWRGMEKEIAQMKAIGVGNELKRKYFSV